VEIFHAGEEGIYIGLAESTGVYVDSTTGNGFHVRACGEEGLTIGAAGGGGVEIFTAGSYGVAMGYAGWDGVYVQNANWDGVHVVNTVDDGFRVERAGNNGVTVDSAHQHGCEVLNLEVGSGVVIKDGYQGVYVEGVTHNAFVCSDAGGDGLRVVDCGGDGVKVKNAPNDGMYVEHAGYNGVYVDSTTLYDGVHIRSCGDDGINVTLTNDDGIYIQQTGGSGVYIVATSEDGITIENPGDDGIYVTGSESEGLYVTDAGYDAAYLRTGVSHGYGLYCHSYMDSVNYQGIYTTGKFTATGTKSCVVETPQGMKALYSIESPEVEFMVSGKAQLVDGEAYVEFPWLFSEAISDEIPLKITATPEGSWSGLYVSGSSIEGFTVESGAGDPNAQFDWLAIGRRDGYEVTDNEAISPERAALEAAHERERQLKEAAHRAKLEQELQNQAEIDAMRRERRAAERDDVSASSLVVPRAMRDRTAYPLTNDIQNTGPPRSDSPK
jgi:hypothetical protein